MAKAGSLQKRSVKGNTGNDTLFHAKITDNISLVYRRIKLGFATADVLPARSINNHLLLDR